MIPESDSVRISHAVQMWMHGENGDPILLMRKRLDRSGSVNFGPLAGAGKVRDPERLYGVLDNFPLGTASEMSAGDKTEMIHGYLLPKNVTGRDCDARIAAVSADVADELMVATAAVVDAGYTMQMEIAEELGEEWEILNDRLHGDGADELIVRSDAPLRLAAYMQAHIPDRFENFVAPERISERTGSRTLTKGMIFQSLVSIPDELLPHGGLQQVTEGSEIVIAPLLRVSRETLVSWATEVSELGDFMTPLRTVDGRTITVNAGAIQAYGLS